MILCGVRHADGQKNVFRVDNVETFEDAIAAVREQLTTAKTILALVPKEQHVQAA